MIISVLPKMKHDEEEFATIVTTLPRSDGRWEFRYEIWRREWKEDRWNPYWVLEIIFIF